MKFLTFILLLVSNLAVAQTFQVLHADKGEPIPGATIQFSQSKGTFTDIDGYFHIKKLKNIDSVQISSVGFYSKSVSKSELLSNTVIFLKEDVSQLDEILLKKTTSKILKHKIPLKIKNYAPRSIHRSSSFNSIEVTFIPYPEELKTKGPVKIKSIVVHTMHYGWPDPEKEGRFYPFKVNLYKSSTQKKHPKLKDSLLTGIRARRLKGQPNPVIIPIDDKELMLPKEGIYVSFEALDASEYPTHAPIPVPRILAKRGGLWEHPTIGSPMLKVILVNPKKATSYSYSLNKKGHAIILEDGSTKYYWEKQKDFIYNITIEIEY